MKFDTLSMYVSKGLSTRRIANMENVTQSTVKWWLKKYNLKTIPSHGGQLKPFDCSVCHETDSNKFYHGRKTKCKSCVNREDLQISIKKKLKAIHYMGGKCINCGYNKYYGALEFHHINPAEKEDWKNLRNWGWERIKCELAKCVLLCSNCHKERHHALLEAVSGFEPPISTI